MTYWQNIRPFVFIIGCVIAFSLLMSSHTWACEIRPEITNYPHPLKCFKTITLESGAKTIDKDSMVLLLSADIRFSEDCKTAIYYTRDGKPFDLSSSEYRCE